MVYFRDSGFIMKITNLNCKYMFCLLGFMVLALCIITSGQDNSESLEQKKFVFVSGDGEGELLVNVSFKKSLPVFSDRYTWDIIGINIPPIVSPYDVKLIRTPGMEEGYKIETEGVLISTQPNYFSISASEVNTLVVGLKKSPYSMLGYSWANMTRVWISKSIPADEYGYAIAESEDVSPGQYHVKIFGDANNNVSQVNLTLKATKKIIINGHFDLIVDRTGIPNDDFKIDIKSLNGTYKLNQMTINVAPEGGAVQ